LLSEDVELQRQFDRRALLFSNPKISDATLNPPPNPNVSLHETLEFGREKLQFQCSATSSAGQRTDTTHPAPRKPSKAESKVVMPDFWC